MIGKVRLTSRGPGGPMEPADHDWVRAMRRDGKTLRVIASYFEPQPTSSEIRAVLQKTST
jgi:hypothetical protein